MSDNITEKLSRIQSELIAPKNQFNKFGNYNYRSCEDIVEAAKPLLLKEGLALTLSDDMVEVGGRVYVKATAKVESSGQFTAVTAFAREPAEQKGMACPQITGSASSYARKYALNGLFAIDDTKDADTMKPVKEEKAVAKKETPLEVDTLLTFIPSCKTEKSLDNYYKENSKFINNLFENEQGEVLAAFKKQKSIIKGDK